MSNYISKVQLTNNVVAEIKDANAQTSISNLTSNLSSEIENRESADTTLQSNINAEKTARQSADSTLQNNIDAEETARQSADTTLQNNINAEKTARQNADTTLQNAINTINNNIGNVSELETESNNLVGAINEIKSDISEHYWLLVTDSYGDPSAVGSDDTWLEQFENLTSENCLKVYKGGYGFAPSYNAPFINLITPGVVDTGVPSSFDTSLITDIVVLGGFNDRAVAVNTIKSAISDFCTYARNTYSNLKNIFIGACGWSMNHEHMETLVKGRYIKAYSECAEYGAIYLNGLDNVLHDFTLYNAEENTSLLLGYQYVHPNTAGSLRLAQSTINAIKNGYATCKETWQVKAFTLESGITVNGNATINTAQLLDNDNVYLVIPVQNYRGTFSISTNINTIELATIDHGYINGDIGYVPCKLFIAGGDVTTNRMFDGQYFINGGKLKIVLFQADIETLSFTNIYVFPTNAIINLRDC